MSREPNKRHLNWFTNPRLGRFWQRSPQSSQRSRGWLKGRRSAPEESASHRLGGQPLPPPWEPAVPGATDLHDRSPRTIWRRFGRTPHRQQVGLAAGAGGLVLVSLVGIVVLCSHMPLIGNGTPSAGGVSRNASSTSTALAATTITPASSFTITFTCASGIVKQTGEVCVHTQANAVLSLTVRYCDGSYAGGKGLHGSVSSDNSGNYIWRFSVHTRCAGTATATVVAKSSGQSVTESTMFTITH
jgi:hypothetical protein